MTRVGTPLYLAPEMIKREKYGVFHDSDLYKKKISIFEMYKAFMGNSYAASWEDLNNSSAEIRSILSKAVKEVLYLEKFFHP